MLYRVSLEHPGVWWMTLGPALGTEPPYLSVDRLDAFIVGYSAGRGTTSTVAEDDGFFSWLRDEANVFRQQGWARVLLDRCQGNQQAAIQQFFDLLHQFLLMRRPVWFVAFNREPRTSLTANGLGTPQSSDVRNPDHVRAVTGADAIVGPNIRISAIDFRDGSSFFVGLPPDVRSWWIGSGLRIALALQVSKTTPNSDPRVELDALPCSRGALLDFGEGLDAWARASTGAGPDACVIDAEQERATVITLGACGAIHIRAGDLRCVTGAVREVNRWSMEPGDRLLCLSPPLFSYAKQLPLGVLPANLSAGEPISWAQCIDGPARRLAVSVEWRPPA